MANVHSSNPQLGQPTQNVLDAEALGWTILRSGVYICILRHLYMYLGRKRELAREGIPGCWMLGAL